MKGIRRFLSVSLMITIVLGLTACGSDSSSEVTTDDKTLVIALQNEPGVLDPYQHSNETGFIAASTVLEPLFKSDNGVISPWLATGYNVVDDETIEISLRDDVYFSNGEKMTADDVLFTLGYASESSFSNTFFGAIDPEASFKTDDYNVTLKLSNPYAPLIEALSCYRCGIISEKAFNEMGAQEFSRNPIGTGAMKMDKWITGDRIELVAVDNYWGEMPDYDSVTYRFILEGSSRAIELESGGVDIAMDLAPADWTRIDNNENLTLLDGMSTKMSYLCFNNSMEPFNNELVRKGLAYAIDIDAVVKAAWNGNAEGATSFFAESIPGHKVEGPWEYNPEKAKELLAEAGYPEGTLNIEFVTFEQQYYKAAGQVIQSMWSQVGVNCEIKLVDLATFTTMNNAGELPTTVMSNGAAIMDPAIALLAWPTARTISLRHNDPIVDEYLAEGVSVYDMADRIPIYEDMQDYLWDKLYLLPLVYPKIAYAYSNDIQGLEFSADAVPDLTNVSFK